MTSIGQSFTTCRVYSPPPSPLKKNTVLRPCMGTPLYGKNKGKAIFIYRVVADCEQDETQIKIYYTINVHFQVRFLNGGDFKDMQFHTSRNTYYRLLSVLCISDTSYI